MLGGALGRSLTSLALLCGTFAWAGWVYLHTIGDPHRIESMATAVLDDPAARSQLARAIADQFVSSAGLDPSDLPMVEAAVDVTLGDPRIAANVVSALGSAHANALGVDDARPTTIDTSGLLSATRDHLASFAPDLVALLPDGAVTDVTLPKYHPPGAGTLRSLARPATTVFAVVGALLLGAAFVLGDRRRTLRRFGTWAIVQGIGWLVFPLIIVAAARQWAPSFADVIAVVTRVSSRSITPAAAGLVIGGLIAIVVWVVPSWWPAENGGSSVPTEVPQRRPSQPASTTTRHEPSFASTRGATGAPATPVAPIDTFVRSPGGAAGATPYQNAAQPYTTLTAAANDDIDPWAHFFGTENP